VEHVDFIINHFDL